MSIRIVLVDDHKMFRETLRIPLELEKDMQVVAEAGTGAELLDKLPTVDADILILDVGLPDMNGIAVARQVSERQPGIKIIALSGFTDRIFVEEMMKAGARAFVAKSAGADELVFAVRAVAAGRIFLSPEVAMSAVRHMTSPIQGDPPPLSILGNKEREVLRLVAGGKSSPEIGAILGISPATVNVHRRNIRQKLNLHSVAELTRYAIREGLIAVE
jgi:two-component system NarL family response regulator